MHNDEAFNKLRNNEHNDEDDIESLPEPVKTPKRKRQRASLPQNFKQGGGETVVSLSLKKITIEIFRFFYDDFFFCNFQKIPKGILVKRGASLTKSDTVSPPRSTKKRRQTTDLDNNDDYIYATSHVRGNYAAEQLLNRPTLSTNVRPVIFRFKYII